ncbi:hypothetical protein BDY24DRAFT_379321 [Mrakia frigida]|uniref:1-phosphatidylinositol-4-phosphate 5-kinase n=1 Tax=Mrakia frigida TaxID=29902 RepID=UPI003FCC124C
MSSPLLVPRPPSSQADHLPPSSAASTSSFQTAQDSIAAPSSSSHSTTDDWTEANGGGGEGRATPTGTRSEWQEGENEQEENSQSFTSRSTAPPQVNPFHLLSQSQAQYAAVVPPPKGLLARSPPSHPPPSEVHVHKISNDRVVLVAGPAQTGGAVEIGAKRLGAAIKGVLKGGGGSGDVPPSLETNELPSRMGGPPPSPPPSEGGTTPIEEDVNEDLDRPSSSRSGHPSSSGHASKSTVDTSLSSPPPPPPFEPSSASTLPPPVPSKERTTTPILTIPLRESPILEPEDPSPTESDALPPLPSHDEISLRKSSMSSSVNGGGRMRMASESDTERMGFAAPGSLPSSPVGPDSSLPPPPSSSRPSPTSNSGYFDGHIARRNTPPSANATSTTPPAIPASSLLHPSSASIISVTPPSPTRRNTTGSSNSIILPPSSPQPSNPPTLPRANLHKTLSHHSSHQARASSTPVPAPSKTDVPGVDGAAVDSDILAQMETIRKERLSRRARQAATETSSIGGGEGEGGQEGARVNLDGSSAGPSHQTRARSGTEGGKGAATQEEARVLVGNLIGEDHVNYVLMYNMLTGIRIGVSRCQAKISRPLTPEDFLARHKFSFDMVGNELTPSARYDFKFKDYAPWVFRDLRDNHFHLDAADYLLSLTAKYILSELGSPGKSGSFFYFSRDYRFIIKTISHTEHKFLRKILPQYHAHVASNPHTLLSRFYGLHRVKLPRGRKIHFVIMNNLFPPHRDIHETFDLKGSSVGREYPEEKAKNKKGAVLKDINWVRRDRKLDLGPEKAALLSEQLRRDAEFLKKMHIMDYSLLVGIHEMERGNRDGLRAQNLQLFDPNVGGLVRRKPSSVKNNQEAQALRKAVLRSDPRSIDHPGTRDHLTEADTADRKHFLFYQDEGGLRATDECNQSMDVIYYLGVIDICTPYSFVKKVEHMWKSFTEDRHGISAVPPNEYGERFLNFLLSCLPNSDPALRPAGLRSKDIKPLPDVPAGEQVPINGTIPPPNSSTDQVDTNEHIFPKKEKPKYKAE